VIRLVKSGPIVPAPISFSTRARAGRERGGGGGFKKALPWHAHFLFKKALPHKVNGAGMSCDYNARLKQHAHKVTPAASLA
jgi:hypothetical protein